MRYRMPEGVEKGDWPFLGRLVDELAGLALVFLLCNEPSFALHVLPSVYAWALSRRDYHWLTDWLT